MIVKTPGSQMGSPAAADKGGEEMGGEKCESGPRATQNWYECEPPPTYAPLSGSSAWGMGAPHLNQQVARAGHSLPY